MVPDVDVSEGFDVDDELLDCSQLHNSNYNIKLAYIHFKFIFFLI